MHLLRYVGETSSKWSKRCLDNVNCLLIAVNYMIIQVHNYASWTAKSTVNNYVNFE